MLKFRVGLNGRILLILLLGVFVKKYIFLCPVHLVDHMIVRKWIEFLYFIDFQIMYRSKKSHFLLIIFWYHNNTSIFTCILLHNILNSRWKLLYNFYILPEFIPGVNWNGSVLWNLVVVCLQNVSGLPHQVTGFPHLLDVSEILLKVL